MQIYLYTLIILNYTIYKRLCRSRRCSNWHINKTGKQIGSTCVTVLRCFCLFSDGWISENPHRNGMYVRSIRCVTAHLYQSFRQRLTYWSDVGRVECKQSNNIENGHKNITTNPCRTWPTRQHTQHSMVAVVASPHLFSRPDVSSRRDISARTDRIVWGECFFFWVCVAPHTRFRWQIIIWGEVIIDGGAGWRNKHVCEKLKCYRSKERDIG